MIKIKDITSALEIFAPLSYQEDYDNSGLIVGDSEWSVNGILISLDCTEEVLDEAIRNNCNLVISHHPLIFKGIKKLNPKSYIERTVIKAIKHDIGIYAIHTNLDNIINGVNFKIAEKLQLNNIKILSAKPNLLEKLITYVPVEQADAVLQALFHAGAGKLGNYSHCSFTTEGSGSFMPDDKAQPFIGESGNLEYVNEVKAEVIFHSSIREKVRLALLQAHPYETPAYEIYRLANESPDIGSGIIGTLTKPMSESSFVAYLKIAMRLTCIRHTKFTGRDIQKIGLCGGSGSFLLSKAMKENVDIFITGDFKYHEFFDADGKLIIADIGHYESEVFTKELIFDFLNEKFSNIAILLTNVNTNPVQYFY